VKSQNGIVPQTENAHIFIEGDLMVTSWNTKLNGFNVSDAKLLWSHQAHANAIFGLLNVPHEGVFVTSGNS
jgi:outer membrane protein assembly factor BamB